jgi:putative sporulation protein YyaC
MFHSTSDEKTSRGHLFCHYADRGASYRLSQQLSFILRENPSEKDALFFCIGTDRATGDSLGPLVGTRLRQLLPQNHIYGTLENPIHAGNLKDELAAVLQKHSQPFILAVDACLGSAKQIGCIQLGTGSLYPGAALHKNLPAVGDCHLTGTVGAGGFCEPLVLQSTRLHLVYTMAETISRMIFFAWMKCFGFQGKRMTADIMSP